MSDNPKVLIEGANTEYYFKCYDYKHFNDIQEIVSAPFGKVFRAKWKKSDKYLVIKTFFNIDNATAIAIVRELQLQREAHIHDNIIRLHGITEQSDDPALVIEYADNGTLRDYLKKNFNNLTWNDKLDFGYQLAYAVSCLHNEGIVHSGLHSENVMVHQNFIKLADLGLSKVIETSSSKLFGVIPYIDPKTFTPRIKYELNEKCDVYSVGVLLWEISSGKPPFGEQYDVGLAQDILGGVRETPIPDTPSAYVRLYTECWNGEPGNRPTIGKVIDQLKATKSNQTENLNTMKLLSEQQQFGEISLNIRNLEQNDFSDFKQLAKTSSNEQDKKKNNILVNEPVSFNKQEKLKNDMLVTSLSTAIDEDKQEKQKNIEKPLSIVVSEDKKYENDTLVTSLSTVIEEDKQEKQKNDIIEKPLSTVVDEDEKDKNDILVKPLSAVVEDVVNLILKEINEGKELKAHILDYYCNNYNISLQEICNWLLNNKNLNFIRLLGDFKFSEIETRINKLKEFEQGTADLGHSISQCNLANMYIDGECVDKELYQKAADLGCSKAQYNLAYMYKNGDGIEKDCNKAVELFTKSAEGGYLDGIMMLGVCYYNGIGTNIDKHKAFELYQKAANLGHSVAQYNLAFMYKNGEDIDIDYNKAFELCKISARGGYLHGIMMLAECHYYGMGTNVDEKTAKELYQKAANLGHSMAQYKLANMYEYGKIVNRDYSKAFELYQKSAEEENIEGIKMLKHYFRNKIGIVVDEEEAYELYQYAKDLEYCVALYYLARIYKNCRDYNKAFELSKQSAEGCLSGMNLLGYYYQNGIGTNVDKKKAFELYHRAANLGHSKAQFNLALMYKDGEGIEKGDNKAFELFKKSDERKHISGTKWLGYCYDKGIGTSTNKQKAIELYQKAANLEYSKAQYNLAMMYKNGKINKDYNKAFELFRKSAEGNYPYGIIMLGYCYQNGIGTNVDKQKATKLATNLGHSALYDLAKMYKDGEIVDRDYNKTSELFKKSTEEEYLNAINMLGKENIMYMLNTIEDRIGISEINGISDFNKLESYISAAKFILGEDILEKLDDDVFKISDSNNLELYQGTAKFGTRHNVIIFEEIVEKYKSKEFVKEFAKEFIVDESNGLPIDEIFKEGGTKGVFSDINIGKILTSQQILNGEHFSQFMQQFMQQLRFGNIFQGGSMGSNQESKNDEEDVYLTQIAENDDEENVYIAQIPRKKGLQNLGNTCFMNGILQALFNSVEFRNRILQIKTTKLITSTTYQLQRCFACMMLSTNSKFIPSALFETLPTSLNNYRQQDCHEFFKILFDQIEEESKNSKKSGFDLEDDVPICSFSGELENTIKCLACGYKSKTKEKFRDLSLSLKVDTSDNLSFSDLLSKFFSAEELKGDDQYFCEKCAEYRDAEKLTRMVTPPHYLILSLKRFEYDMNYDRRIKIMTHVSIQDSLSVALNDETEDILYDLSAIVIHTGFVAEYGHYYTYAKDEENGEWHKYNDSYVSVSSLSKIISEGNESDTPYLLFFKQKNIMNHKLSKISRSLINEVKREDSYHNHYNHYNIFF